MWGNVQNTIVWKASEIKHNEHIGFHIKSVTLDKILDVSTSEDTKYKIDESHNSCFKASLE